MCSFYFTDFCLKWNDNRKCLENASILWHSKMAYDWLARLTLYMKVTKVTQIPVDSLIGRVSTLSRFRIKMIDEMLSTRADLQLLVLACMCSFGCTTSRTHVWRIGKHHTHTLKSFTNNNSTNNSRIRRNCVIVARSYSISFDLRSLAVNIESAANLASEMIYVHLCGCNWRRRERKERVVRATDVTSWKSVAGNSDSGIVFNELCWASEKHDPYLMIGDDESGSIAQCIFVRFRNTKLHQFHCVHHRMHLRYFYCSNWLIALAFHFSFATIFIGNMCQVLL